MNRNNAKVGYSLSWYHMLLLRESRCDMTRWPGSGWQAIASRPDFAPPLRHIGPDRPADRGILWFAFLSRCGEEF